MISITKERHTV